MKEEGQENAKIPSMFCAGWGGIDFSDLTAVKKSVLYLL